MSDMRKEPVPVSGNEKKGPGDFSGLWRIALKVHGGPGIGWEIVGYEFEEGISYDEALRVCSGLPRQPVSE